uniref:(S)-ureidoglycine aminohydrolase cupin domain-containing protein n=1 Tax=Oryza punctata TaxID=4537 RepID=A0A0E0M8G5_ORYPU
MASSSSPPPPCTVAGGTVAVERSPPESRLSELGARSWPKWGGGPGRMALSFGARQTCYIVRGKATATATATAVEGSPENGRVEFGAGDLVVFPRGTRCTWHIAAAVDMHYAFDPS